MHYTKGILAIIVSLGLALVLLPLSIASANGTVTVGIDAPAEVDPGSPFVANVTVSYVTNFDSCFFDVTYDQTVIHVTNVTGGVIGGHAIVVGASDWTYVPPGSDTGRIRVLAISSVNPIICGTNGTGYLAQIHFTGVGSAGRSSGITVGNVTMSDCLPPLGHPISTQTGAGASVGIRGVAPVGGTAYPPNKVLMLAPWIVLGAAIIVATSLLVRRRRSATR
jgi:hypothetical protein